jgi:nitrate/nitrite transport system substrate-binding protein
MPLVASGTVARSVGRKVRTAVNRKVFLFGALGATLAGCGDKKPAPAGAGGSTAGDKIRIGFIPLTDCASIVMADKLGLFKKYGLDVEVTKEANWANIRDKLLTGELSAAHCLFGMPFAVNTGFAGPAGKELKIAMILNVNGQGITLKKELAASDGYGDLSRVKPAVDALKAAGKIPTFAMTFPGGTHDIWLRYWLAAAGVDATKESKDVQIKVIPPPQMVANMKVGGMDGYCVGEPWNSKAVQDDIGFTTLATQDLWKDHPEKALVANPEFAEKRRDDLTKMVMAILEASIWLDKLENRAECAKVIGGEAYVKASADAIQERLEGKYKLGGGLPDKTFVDDYMLFHKGGEINAPRKGHAIWFLSQYVRFGYLPSAPDYQRIADSLILSDLYKEAAGELKLAIPDDDMKSFRLKLDNKTFDPTKPDAGKASG